MKRTTLFLTALTLIFPGVAAADDKQTCLVAADNAQTLRQQHKPLAAREPLRVCVRDLCPAAIVKDCTTWFDENTGLVPTIQLVAKDGRGVELLAVKVSMDGTVLAQRLDGKMLEVEVGEHVFVFESADGTKVEKRIAVYEGQKGQQVVGEFPAPPEPPKRSELETRRQEATRAAAERAVTQARIEKERVEERQRQQAAAQAAAYEAARNEKVQDARYYRNVGLILGGVGLAVGATGIAFTVAGSNEKSAIVNGGLASGKDISSAASNVTMDEGLSYTGLLVGGALVLVGASFLIFGPSAPAGPSPTGQLQFDRGIIRW